MSDLITLPCAVCGTRTKSERVADGPGDGWGLCPTCEVAIREQGGDALRGPMTVKVGGLLFELDEVLEGALELAAGNVVVGIELERDGDGRVRAYAMLGSHEGEAHHADPRAALALAFDALVEDMHDDANQLRREAWALEKLARPAAAPLRGARLEDEETRALDGCRSRLRTALKMAAGGEAEAWGVVREALRCADEVGR